MTRIPIKGERVNLPALPKDFIVLAVRKKSRVVDLHLAGNPTSILNDVPWNRLTYPEHPNKTASS